MKPTLFSDSAAIANKYIFIDQGRYDVDHACFSACQPIRCIWDGRYKLAINAITTHELKDLQAGSSEMKNLEHAVIHSDECLIRPLWQCNSVHKAALKTLPKR